jgi:hypothetical protein
MTIMDAMTITNGSVELLPDTPSGSVDPPASLWCAPVTLPESDEDFGEVMFCTGCSACRGCTFCGSCGK